MNYTPRATQSRAFDTWFTRNINEDVFSFCRTATMKEVKARLLLCALLLLLSSCAAQGTRYFHFADDTDSLRFPREVFRYYHKRHSPVESLLLKSVNKKKDKKAICLNALCPSNVCCCNKVEHIQAMCK